MVFLFSQQEDSYGLVVDGATLRLIFPVPDYKELFYQLAIRLQFLKGRFTKSSMDILDK